MKYNPKLFTSYGFIIGLCLLLGNDLILKPLWGNWLTGKLSDFAGLFVFTLFWMAFLPRFKKIITVCTGLLFICWKSPYSQSCIDFWNTLPLFAIHRVVDYTDLLALIILPLAFYYERNIEKIRSFKLSPVFPILISVFAFMATSYFSNIDINKTYQFNYSKETLENRLSNIDSLHITFTDNNPDSIYFFFPFHKWGLCNTVDMDIVITEIDTNVTLLKLVKSSHRCQANKNDKALIIEAFEKEIIEKLKTDISINDSSRQ